MNIFKENLTGYYTAWLQAALECGDVTHEEQGGIILEREGVFEFAKIRNMHQNTPTAAGLYETDHEELKYKIFPKVFNEGWKMHASFHTHPAPMSSTPSHTDLSKLFQGFKYNIILAVYDNMFSYSMWCADDNICTAYLRMQLVKTLTK